MKTNIRKSFLLGLVLTFVVAMSLFAGTINFAKAQTENTTSPIYIADASVRIMTDDMAGIRFRVVMDVDTFDSITDETTENGWKDGVEVGALVAPTALVKSNEWTRDTANAKVAKKLFKASMWIDDEIDGVACKVSTINLYDFPANRYAREMSSVCYLVDSGNVYYSQRYSDSMYKVAQRSLDSGLLEEDEYTLISRYIDEAIVEAEFTSLPENAMVELNTPYTVQMPTSNVGEISWTAEVYNNTVQPFGSWGTTISTYSSANGDQAITLTSVEYTAKIKYTLTYEDQTLEAYSYLFAKNENMIAIEELYPNYIVDGEYVYAGCGEDADSPRFEGETAAYGATGNIVINFSNALVGDNYKSLECWVYNPHDETLQVKAFTNNLTINVPAKSYIRFYPAGWIRDCWGTVSGNKLAQAYFTANINGVASPFYLMGFAVNADAYDLGQIGVSGSVTENTLTATWKAANATNYVYEILVNDQVVESAETTEAGITYDLTNYIETMVQVEVQVTAHGKDGATSTASFVQNDLEFTYVPENGFVDMGEAYTVPMATAKKGTVTWKAELIDGVIGINAPNTVAATYTSDKVTQISIPVGYHYFFYKITYTVTVGEYTKNAYSYVFLKEDAFLSTDMMKVSECYDDYIGSLTLGGSAQVSDYEIMPGEKTIKVTGANGNATGSFVGGEVLGNNAFPKTVYFWVYNPTDSDISVTFKLGISLNYTIKANSYLCIASYRWDNGGMTAFQPNNFGAMTAGYVWRTVSMTATNTSGADIEFYVGAFNVAEGDLTRK